METGPVATAVAGAEVSSSLHVNSGEEMVLADDLEVISE